MGLFQQIFGGKTQVEKDATAIYSAFMVQSRDPQFYGDGLMPDNYDGRIDVLTVHIASLLTALRAHGDAGQALGQALFDEMKDDFEIALRELALGDTGVAKRIKPMIALFYTRAKAYAEAIAGESPTEDLEAVFADSLDLPLKDTGPKRFAAYTQSLAARLSEMSLAGITQASFDYPTF